MDITPLGIIAGKGDLPKKIIECCRACGRPFVVLAFRGQTDPSLVEDVPHRWVSLGVIAEPLAYLKDQGVRELVLAGALTRPSLSQMALDSLAVRWLATLGRKAFGDDGLLTGLVGLMEKEGFRILPVQSLLKDLQSLVGPLGSLIPSEESWLDIRRGEEVLRALGPLDVGQALIVEEGVVLSIEGAEGTDRLMERTRELQKTPEGGILVKMTKPHQSRMVDLPTIGIQTIQVAQASGLKGIAVEAGTTLILDRERVAEEADRMGLFVVAFSPKETA